MRRLLRLGVLAAAPWPLAYACSKPRLARAYPTRTAVRALYLGVYAGTAATCGVFLPWLLVPFGVVAAGGALTGLWLMRPNSGRLEGLPPGALSLVPVRQFVDEGFLTRHIARHGAVSKTTWPTLNSPLVCVYGLRRGADVLRDHKPHLAPVGIAFDPLIPAGFLRNMAPDDHSYYKRLFGEAFSDAVVDARLGDFDAAVHDELERIVAASGRKGTDPRPGLLRACVAALAPLVLGVERGTGDFARVVEVYDAMGELVEPRSVDSRSGRWYRDAADEVEQILRRRAADALEALSDRREPAPSLLTEIARAQPDALDDRSVTLNLVFLLRTTSVDLASLLHWIMKTLAENPEWGGRVRDNGSSDLAERVVLETLRLHQSEFIQRRVLEPFEVEGYTVPAGWHLRLCVHESHRDSAIFPAPDSFDPDRFAGRRFSRYEYSPFGRLEHRCIGASTTVAIATCFVTTLSAGYDWKVVRDGPPEFNRYHWRPSRRFRVRLEPRKPAV